MSKINFSALNTKLEPDKVTPMPPSTPTTKPINPFDIEVAKQKLAPFKAQIEKMRKQVQAHNITDEKSQAEAITMAGQASALSKKVTAMVDAMLRQHNDFRNAVNKMKKFFTEPLDGIPREVKRKNGDYLTKLRIAEQKRQAEEERKKKALQKELDKEAEDAGVNKVVLPDTPVVNKVEKIARTESGSSMSVKFEWKGIIVDPDKIDRIFCLPDQKLVDEAVKAGLREADGLEIKEVPVQRLRA